MSKQLSRFAPALTALVIFVGGLAVATAGCGGDGAREFGGGDTSGKVGGTGGANGASGGNSGSGSGGHVGTGSGGASSTGGMSAPGTGGLAQSGGAPGSGGSGATGSGGRANTGGVPGSGGTGTGASGGRGGTGATGTGGTGSGGRANTGGAPATGGAPGTGGSTASSCDAIAADYQAEIPNARACNTITHITTPQCQVMAPSALGCGNSCIIYVQDNSRLVELNKKWNSNGCPNMIRVCPAIVCVEAKPGYCYASTGSVTAQCQAGPRT